jgi:hypothetical protein
MRSMVATHESRDADRSQNDERSDGSLRLNNSGSRAVCSFMEYFKGWC